MTLRPFDASREPPLARASAAHPNSLPPGARMFDIILIAMGLGFFALSVGYTIACDRL
jgi:hypothetical protein